MDKITIKNVKTQLLLDKQSNNFASYFDLINICLNKPVPEGITFKQMKKSLELISKFDGVFHGDADYSFALDKEDLSKIKTEVENHLWPVLHQDIVMFSEYIMSL